MGLACAVWVVADIAAAPLDCVHHMKPVQVPADHTAILERVIAKTGVCGADILVQHGLVMTVETELKGVCIAVNTGLRTVVVLLRKGGREQFFVLAAVGGMAGCAATLVGCGLVQVFQLHCFLDIFDVSCSVAFLGADLLVMAAQAKGLGTCGEQCCLVA